MAIIVEEEKSKPKNSASFLGLILIVVVIAAAAYYIFFSNPAPATVTAPADLQNINNISQTQASPSGVVNNPSFQSLKQYVVEPTSTGPASVGKIDPFLPQ